MNPSLVFESSKAGELTCSFQGKYLHSKYNPTNEGEKFAAGIKADFSPLCVFILEPALSYCAPFLKKRFPKACICAIRFCDDFSKSDSLWDKVFYINNQKSVSLSELLFNSLGEEMLISCLAFDWLPSKSIYEKESFEVWTEIKKAVLKARDVIGTRAFFSKRWLKNSLIFAKNVSSTYLLKKGTSPVVIAASGPSLLSTLPFLKEYRDSFFLIALSSAFMPLSKNGIKADLVISTDGGFWAKKHLDFSGNDFDTVYALEAEGAVPGKILTQKKILPLCYKDGLEKHFLESINVPYMISERNGTVAGTALCFAHSITSGKIYLCGLDQAPSPSFQHTQPNSLETDNSQKDYRLRNTESRITSSRFKSSDVLEIYRNWFISNSEYFSQRVFRLSDNYKYDFSLGKIADINWDEFNKNERKSVSKENTGKPQIIKSDTVPEKKRKSILMKKLLEISKTEEFLCEVFPMDAILIKRELSQEKKDELKSKLEEKIENLLKECEKLISSTVCEGGIKNK